MADRFSAYGNLAFANRSKSALPIQRQGAHILVPDVNIDISRAAKALVIKGGIHQAFANASPLKVGMHIEGVDGLIFLRRPLPGDKSYSDFAGLDRRRDGRLVPRPKRCLCLRPSENRRRISSAQVRRPRHLAVGSIRKHRRMSWPRVPRAPEYRLVPPPLHSSSRNQSVRRA